jgi:hypothetical protein
VPGLITGGLGDPTDRGGSDPGVAAALSAFAAGQGSEHAVLTALAGARLLVPVVAVLAEAEDEDGTGVPGPPAVHEDGAGTSGPPAVHEDGAGISGPPAADEDGAGISGPSAADEDGAGISGPPAADEDGAGIPGPPAAAGPARPRGEKVSEMALPTLVGGDGRLAVLAFTCLRSLTAWRPDARPVPVTARQAWQAGVEEASAVVIDVAGPVPLAVDGARLAALAAGRPPPLPHEDPDVRALADAAVAGEPLIAGFALRPGEDGSDLTIQVTLARGHGPAQAGAQAALRRAAERIAAGAGGRVRRGITVAASTGDRPAHARAGPPGAQAGGP